MSDREELDAKIAELMGWVRGDSILGEYWVDNSEQIIERIDDWQPSRDIAAAMLAVEKMRERSIHINIISQEDGYLVTAADFKPQLNLYFHMLDLRADNFEELPEAICKAAVLAAEAE